ncbi:MAG TPA: NUDIX hydrolase [Armatimonadota bacterium]|jgi:ADP-ribose pyrophosphatase
MGGVTRHPWRVKSSTQHKTGRFTVTVDEIQSPDGSRDLTWTYIQARHAVIVMAVDAQERVLLVREYRHPMGGDVLNLVAGAAHHCVSDEELRSQAAQELAEEAGLLATKWDSIGSFCPVPSWTAADFHLYVARGLKGIEHRGHGAEWEEIEELVWVPAQQLYEDVLQGLYCDGGLVTAVLWAVAKGLLRVSSAGLSGE